jgi:putative component of membrane protein insertase Oxa1/YidC/SpoIIIJ protein YidD
VSTLAGIRLGHDLPRAALLAAIRFYKRRVSPHKGFACAYRVHTGRCSCSTLGYRAIARYGAWQGLGVLRLRLGRCREAFERHRARAPAPRGAQAGFCDVPCDSCDLPADGCDNSVCDCLDCGGSGIQACGDCGTWLRRRRARAQGSDLPLERTAHGSPAMGVSQARGKP